MPKVSIITPVHDRPQYLEEAVDSIQRQSYTDWEHIIVDDGSTNALTRGILKKVALLPKTVFYRTDNKGLGAARNFGIERSSGEFILTLDDDDKWQPDFIEKALDVFKKKQGTGVVTAWLKEFGSGNRIVKTPGGKVKDFLIENNSVHGLFKKEYWAACGKYDENFFFQPYTDWDLWLRITGLGYAVEVVDEPLFLYRIHPDGSLFQGARGRHLELFRYLVEKNSAIYHAHMTDALCLLEEKTMTMQADAATNSLFGRLKRLLQVKKARKKNAAESTGNT